MPNTYNTTPLSSPANLLYCAVFCEPLSCVLPCRVAGLNCELVHHPSLSVSIHINLWRCDPPVSVVVKASTDRAVAVRERVVRVDSDRLSCTFKRRRHHTERWLASSLLSVLRHITQLHLVVSEWTMCGTGHEKMRGTCRALSSPHSSASLSCAHSRCEASITSYRPRWLFSQLTAVIDQLEARHK